MNLHHIHSKQLLYVLLVLMMVQHVYATLVSCNGWRRGVVVSALASINSVNRHLVRLLFGRVTVADR